MSLAMSNTMPQRRRSDLLQTLDNVRPEMVRVSPESVDRRSSAVQSLDQTPGQVAYAALIAHYGTATNAAYALKPAGSDRLLDLSLMRREIESCKFERLMRRDPTAFAVVLGALSRSVGPLDRSARIQQLIATIREHLNELEGLAYERRTA